MKEKVLIFDTTLRDGEQAPGASLNTFEKLEIARQLEKLNVDIIEAGFPVSSPAQFEAVQRISNDVNIIIAGLARVKEIDIKAVYDALRDSNKFRIHTFVGTSDIHILGKFGSNEYGKNLKEKRETILKMACDAVAYAKTFTNDVEFSAEDAGRTDLSFLSEVIEAVIDAGANTVNIPDTTGYNFPSEFGAKIAELKRKVSNINKAVISVHCHDDLGLAVANSLSGIEHGARQVECTINGIGERAGNASLEEIVMALKVRHDISNYYTDIKTEEIYNTSKMVSSFTGMIIQPNKALVGDNAFAHESGIHQDGMLKNRETYEIITPETIGVPRSRIILGRHSGKHGLKIRLEKLGYTPSAKALHDIYEKFLALADKKKEVFDEDLRFLMGDQSQKKSEDFYELDYFHVDMGTSSVPTASLKIRSKDKYFQESATGDGAVDASFNAIEKALNIKSKLESYNVRSITSGRQALGEVIVRVRKDENSFTGRGISTDVIEASVKAYLQALSNMQVFQKNKEESASYSLSNISQAV